MREKILNYLATHKNSRIRYMIGDLSISRMELIDLLHALEREGVVKSTMHRDLANMEIYDTWSLA